MEEQVQVTLGVQQGADISFCFPILWRADECDHQSVGNLRGRPQYFPGLPLLE